VPIRAIRRFLIWLPGSSPTGGLRGPDAPGRPQPREGPLTRPTGLAAGVACLREANSAAV